MQAEEDDQHACQSHPDLASWFGDFLGHLCEKLREPARENIRRELTARAASTLVQDSFCNPV